MDCEYQISIGENEVPFFIQYSIVFGEPEYKDRYEYYAGSNDEIEIDGLLEENDNSV